MPSVVYQFTGGGDRFKTIGCNELSRREALGGNLSVDTVDPVEIILEKGLDQPFRITRFYSRFAAPKWRRSAQTIRDCDPGVFVFRFGERGPLRLVTSRGEREVPALSLSVLRAGEPYFSQLCLDQGRVHEVYHAFVPSHLIVPRLPADVEFDVPISTESGDGLAARQLLKLLFHDSETMSTGVRDSIADAFLNACVSSLKNNQEQAVARLNTCERRAAEIIRVIAENAARPDLTVNKVAALCGISRRYVSSLLRVQNLSYSLLVQHGRIRLAKDMLSSPRLRNHTIAEIAMLAGFHSASSFCRVFRQTEGLTAKAFRAAQAGRTSWENSGDGTVKAN